jgi:L-seryl-tRNA(Ser) seleniumtransferase
MGMLAAVEAWAGSRDIQKEYQLWESWLTEISDGITKVQGVRTKMQPPAGASPFPVLSVEWDPDRVGLTAGEVYDLLLSGEPRIMSHASGQGYSFIIRPVSIKPGDHLLVRDRLRAILAAAPSGVKKRSVAQPVADVSGRWDVVVEFAAAPARHVLFLQCQGNALTGLHAGRKLRGDLTGTIDGAEVRLRSRIPFEGNTLTYDFQGKLEDGRIEGEVGLGEYGRAKFTARRASG